MTQKDSNVDRVYTRLRAMAVEFRFKPDARINESTLSKQLGTSRTPLREALNRLVAEGFLTFQNGRGFFCRSLSPALVLDLYGARVAVETETVRLACQRASDDDLLRLRETTEKLNGATLAEDLLQQDEAFHVAIARLSQNAELLAMLQNLNDRVRYIRLIYLTELTEAQPATEVRFSAHLDIVTALQSRNIDLATSTMRRHIENRRKDAAKAVRIAYSQLYVPDDVEISTRQVVT